MSESLDNLLSELARGERGGGEGGGYQTVSQETGGPGWPDP